ncbi:hypothetical protein V322_02210 [Staphylococcus aureus F19466]|nr:hypothetical protein V322_02210 [Staphylococcus aureus F19466]
MFLDEHINRNFDKLNDNDLHIAHFINTHIDECKNMKIIIIKFIKVSINVFI